jgi:hypothetical protein
MGTLTGLVCRAVPRGCSRVGVPPRSRLDLHAAGGENKNAMERLTDARGLGFASCVSPATLHLPLEGRGCERSWVRLHVVSLACIRVRVWVREPVAMWLREHSCSCRPAGPAPPPPTRVRSHAASAPRLVLDGLSALPRMTGMCPLLRRWTRSRASSICRRRGPSGTSAQRRHQ